ncbi:folylpolyglutamate synthase/dihydrofolate synthase family protein [Peptococcaceae bacterium 1198_IL3148]
MNYQTAIGYLQNLTKFGINLGLDRINALLKRLGDPHLKLKVIHVGGTNGKGSTSAIIAAILQQAGYRVGAFTSPHLHRYTERYRVNGTEISEQAVSELVQQLKPHLDAMVAEGVEHPTEFEVSTAMALTYFYQEQVDYVVMEVGLGGAIDSTNVVQPLVSVITNVSMDHMNLLGNSIAEIAQVKAGIIKPQVPVVTAAANKAALAIIKETCNKNGAPLTVVGQDITWSGQGDSTIKGQYLTIKGKLHNYQHLFLPLLGEHQQANAATAIATLEALEPHGVILTPAIVKAGMAKVSWPGRFEVLDTTPTIVLDGAHNLAGVKALVATLNRYFPQRGIVLVLGMLADKERQRVIATLTPMAEAVVITKPNNPRAGDWQQVANWAKGYTKNVYVYEQVADAVDQGIALAKDQQLLCVTGSLYMLAEARAHIFKTVE